MEKPFGTILNLVIYANNSMSWIINIKNPSTVLKQGIVVLFIITLIIVYSCSNDLPESEDAGKEVHIIPDYTDITIPPNIASLNFTISENGKKYITRIYEIDGEDIIIKSSNGNIRIPEVKWKRLLQKCKGKEIFIEIYVKNDGNWLKFPTIINHVSVEPIDNYLVYRLIDPGFEIWNKMGIFQRCLEDFDEKPVITNDMSDGNCMNCHSFCRNNSHTMLFHMRGENSGTIIFNNGKLTKINTKTDNTISSGVYPSWHPGGRYIAFSVNHIVQSFHSIPKVKVEVTDTLSDIIIYDSKQNKVFTSPEISSVKSFETFPNWSPDGRSLYFCSARSHYIGIRYDLLRISFDTATCSFGAIDTIVAASSFERSVSFPRISPDGKYILYCQSDSGNFSIWHSESDLFIKNLSTGESFRLDINSNQAESYHSWSSNGRWIVFSSRRNDGLFTRPYFSYFDTVGEAHKPFILPQKDPEFYSTFLKSYNVPELITSKVQLNPRKMSNIIATEAVPAFFQNLK